jgi:hypothetical protein
MPYAERESFSHYALYDSRAKSSRSIIERRHWMLKQKMTFGLFAVNPCTGTS